MRFPDHYDAGGRLIELNRTADKEGCGRGSVSVKYEYDKNGNNTKMMLPTGNHSSRAIAYLNQSIICIISVIYRVNNTTFNRNADYTGV